jgi:LysM repeat protein
MDIWWVDMRRGILPGSVIQLPYLVKPGETVVSIASKFGISIDHLLSVNPELAYGVQDAEPEDAIPEWYFRDLLGDES